MINGRRNGLQSNYPKNMSSTSSMDRNGLSNKKIESDLGESVHLPSFSIFVFWIKSSEYVSYMFFLLLEKDR